MGKLKSVETADIKSVVAVLLSSMINDKVAWAIPGIGNSLDEVR